MTATPPSPTAESTAESTAETTAQPAARSTRRPAAEPAGPGDGLVRIGAIVFIIGAFATLVTVAPLFLGTDPFPTVAYALSMLMGVGFLIAGAGLLRSIAAQRRQARSAASSSADPAT